MRRWHPITKLAVPSGLLAAGWLVVTGPAEAPATAAAARLRDLPAAAEAARPDALGALAALGYQLELPPRESFRAALERPLFAPSRRPPAAAEAPPPEPEPVAEPRLDGPRAPPFRLIGTVSRRGRTEALVAAAGGPLERAVVGERVAGWLVTEIGPQHLVVEQEGEQHRLAILR
jgi:general secretion pathway protein N